MHEPKTQDFLRPPLAYLVAYLGLKTLDRGIHIFTISDTEAYGEYKPYKFVKSEKEFISHVLDM